MSGRLRARDENIDEKKTGKIWRLMEKKEEEGKKKKGSCRSFPRHGGEALLPCGPALATNLCLLQKAVG